MGPKMKSTKHNFFGFYDLRSFVMKYCNYEYLRSMIFDSSNIFPVACLLFLFEIFVNITVIHSTRYTEIDWKAYMQEVEGVLNGTFDYSLLKGDTGPLVYPAGFVWIYSVLYLITNRGENILHAQYIFGILYLINLLLVFRLYIISKKVPPYVLILTCITSYRIHSIFVLRLFNDPIALILLYASLNAFIDNKWNLGSILFSLAVSVKMNILLFSPCLLLTYYTCLSLRNTLKQLAICAFVQVIVALPFLLTHPINYIVGAFNFGRVFLYQWTVNWRFLPEEIFLSKSFHISLLVIHILLLCAFYDLCKKCLMIYSLIYNYNTGRKSKQKKTKLNMSEGILAQCLLLPLFLANFIGIACSRSLHYQFYMWYFHSLPYLLWSTYYSVTVRLVILGLIEICWNTYPSTNFSSIALNLCHIAIIYGIYRNKAHTYEKLNQNKQK